MIDFIVLFIAYCLVVFWGGLVVKSCVENFKRRNYYWFGVHLLGSIFMAALAVKIVFMQ